MPAASPASAAVQTTSEAVEVPYDPLMRWEWEGGAVLLETTPTLSNAEAGAEERVGPTEIGPRPDGGRKNRARPCRHKCKPTPPRGKLMREGNRSRRGEGH
jgi:hypothetical protein